MITKAVISEWYEAQGVCTQLPFTLGGLEICPWVQVDTPIKYLGQYIPNSITDGTLLSQWPLLPDSVCQHLGSCKIDPRWQCLGQLEDDATRVVPW